MSRLVTFLSFVASLGTLTSCAQPMRWDKPGADQATLLRDQNDCRVAAQEESNRNFYPAPIGPLYGWRWTSAWAQQAESQRFYAETNLTRFCMRNKGWELVPTTASAASGASPPATPISDEGTPAR